MVRPHHHPIASNVVEIDIGAAVPARADGGHADTVRRSESLVQPGGECEMGEMVGRELRLRSTVLTHIVVTRYLNCG